VRKSVTVKKWREMPHPEREILEKLFTDIAPRYAGRAKDAPGGNGGYTRIVKMPARRGDAAPQRFCCWLSKKRRASQRR
jgi:large subunit ribosomal protein L17